jgi:hypothetical protein
MIINSRWFESEFQYRVRWVSDTRATWETIEGLWGSDCSIEQAMARSAAARARPVNGTVEATPSEGEAVCHGPRQGIESPSRRQ